MGIYMNNYADLREICWFFLFTKLNKYSIIIN